VKSFWFSQLTKLILERETGSTSRKDFQEKAEKAAVKANQRTFEKLADKALARGDSKEFNRTWTSLLNMVLGRKWKNKEMSFSSFQSSYYTYFFKFLNVYFYPYFF
jgi:hypothetical protein